MNIKKPHLNIKQKVISVLVFGIFLMFMGWYMILVIHNLSSITHTIVHKDMKARALEKILIDKVLLLEKHEKKFILFGQSSHISEAEKLFKQIMQGLNQLSKYTTTTQEKFIMDKIFLLFNKYNLFSQKMSDDTDLKNKEKIINNKEAFFTKITDNFTKLLNVNQSNIDARISTINKQSRRSAIILISWGMLSIMGMFLSGYMVIKSLLNMVKILKEGTQQLITGNFDYQIQVDSKDEVKEITTAFNIMANKLKDLEKIGEESITILYNEIYIPLNTITENISIILEENSTELNSKQIKTLENIKINCKRIQKTINLLMDFLKLKSGIKNIEKDYFNPSAIIQKVVDTLVPVAKTKKIAIKYQIEKNLDIALGDKKYIKMAIEKLLINRIKASPEKSELIINVKLLTEKTFVKKLAFKFRQMQKILLITIKDEGVGIKPEELYRIFDIFHNIEENFSNPVQNIDLAMCKAIIQAHQGRIWIENKGILSGHGNIFYFSIPQKH